MNLFGQTLFKIKNLISLIYTNLMMKISKNEKIK